MTSQCTRINIVLSCSLDPVSYDFVIEIQTMQDFVPKEPMLHYGGNSIFSSKLLPCLVIAKIMVHVIDDTTHLIPMECPRSCTCCCLSTYNMYILLNVSML